MSCSPGDTQPFSTERVFVFLCGVPGDFYDQGAHEMWFVKNELLRMEPWRSRVLAEKEVLPHERATVALTG